MGLREKLNASPQWGLGVVGVVMVVAMVFGYRAWKGQAPTMPTAFYTIDDGQSYFEDEPGKAVPFEHQGKQAVVANVFKGKDGKLFVGYLERNNPESLEMIKKLKDRRPGDPPPDPRQLGMISKGREYKKPGDKEWVSEAKPNEVMKVKTVNNPDGSPAQRVE